MTGVPSDTSTADRSWVSTLWACLWLSLALAAVFPAIAGFGYSQYGANGILAAAVAALVCWVGATAALVASAQLRGPEQAMLSLSLGMAFRMGLPLAAGFFLSTSGGPVAEAGLIGSLLAYYLVGLVVETLLSLRFISPSAKTSKAA